MDQNDFEQKMINPDVRRTRIRRFWGSVIFLAITLSFIIYYLVFFISAFDLMSNSDIDNGLEAFVMIFAGAALAFTTIIAALIVSVLSFLGAFFGLTSIKYLPTKKMKVWARIVAYTNLAICAASFAFFMFCWLA